MTPPRVDPVEVAHMFVNDDGTRRDMFVGNAHFVMARVVLAAAKVIDTLPSSYDPHDDLVVRHAQALNALAAALKGEK
jgi:hypothetical protein